RPNHAYGTHRLEFERFVRARFPHALVVRLPALFGPGLRKNVLYDLLHANQVERINPASCFQWYPLERLPEDLRRAEAHGLKLANFFTEPLATRLVLERFFPEVRAGAEAQPAAYYDLHTRYGQAFGGDERYVMRAPQVLEEVGR